MGIFSAGAEGGLGGLKGAGKWWLTGFAVTVLGIAVVGAGLGALAAIGIFGAPAIVAGLAIGGLVGLVGGGMLALGPWAGAGGLVAVIGGLFGIGKGIKQNQQRGAGQLEAQSKDLRGERVQLEQDIARLKAQGASIDPNLEASYMAEQSRMTGMLAQQNGQFVNPAATTGHVDSLRQRDAQRQNIPPVSLG